MTSLGIGLFPHGTCPGHTGEGLPCFHRPRGTLRAGYSWQEFKCILAQPHSIFWCTPDALPHRFVDVPQHSCMAWYGAQSRRCCLAWGHYVPPSSCQVESLLTICSHGCEFLCISFPVPPGNQSPRTCSANTSPTCSKVNKTSRQTRNCLKVAPIVPKQAPKPDFSNPEVSVCQGDLQDSHPPHRPPPAPQQHLPQTHPKEPQLVG